MSALERIGSIAIPSTVLDHRFVREARANAMLLEKKADVRRQVVGTANTQACELYGWMPNVDSHVDCTGYVYLVPLDDGRSRCYAWDIHQAEADQVTEVDLPAGAVVRLNDHIEHWTEDQHARVALFVGSWQWPADAIALQLLQAGIDALASGLYYGAPRVREGFRVPLPDECLAANATFDTLEVMLLVDAKAKGRLIERCATCNRPAVRPDPQWPYFTDKSRCRKHIGAEGRNDG